MPAIQRRKIQVTVEYETACADPSGEMVDRITGPLEAASRDLVKDLYSGISGYRIVFTSVRQQQP